jgi:hypothetical protein
MIDLNRSAETDQLLSKIRDMSEMLMADSPASKPSYKGINKWSGPSIHVRHKAGAPAENAEDRSVQAGGSIEDITDIQKQSMDLLKQHGFHVNKVSNAHAEQQGGPMVYMGKKTGAMHQVAEVDPQGMINEETPEEYLTNHVHAEDAKNVGNKPYTPSGARPDPEDPAYDTWQSIAQDHAGEDAESYNAMTHLTQAANQIRDILQTNADDEAQVEHIIRMAQIILGPKSDHTDAEYRKMLDGLIVILNRFIIVPMN